MTLLWKNPAHCENVLLSLLTKMLIGSSQTGTISTTIKLGLERKRGKVRGDASRYRRSRMCRQLGNKSWAVWQRVVKKHVLI